MAAFSLPELYKLSCDMNLISARLMLKKYKHLIFWKENESILEFGVGDGSNSRKALRPLIPKDYRDFVMTDISKAMVDFAKKNEFFPRTKYYELDIASDHVPSNFKKRFDHIFSFFTMMYVKNPEKAFKNIHTMLKPNGQTFLVFLPNLPTDTVHQKLCKHSKWGKYGHEQMITPYSYEEFPEKCFEEDLKRAGFNSYHCIVESLSYTFPDEEAWKGFFLSVNTALANIPNEEIEEYKDFWLKQIYNEVLTDEGCNREVKNKNGRSLKFKLSVICATKLS